MTNELPHDVDVDTFYSVGPKFNISVGNKKSNGKEFNIFKLTGKTIIRCVAKLFDQSVLKNLVLTETHSLNSPYHSFH